MSSSIMETLSWNNLEGLELTNRLKCLDDPRGLT
jgi:hypothetical protein